MTTKILGGALGLSKLLRSIFAIAFLFLFKAANADESSPRPVSG
jgi:hypothetical protein